MSDLQRKRLLELDKRGKPSHPYTPAAETNIEKTFARIRRQQREAAAEAEAQQAANVKPIRRGSAK